jgi:regulatory protein YycH of two-component signal transduction system YycFG
MKESLKTIFLVILVFFSLFQSWVLAYRVPAFDTIGPTNYLKPEKLGDEKKIGDIINPYRVVYHHGDGLHAVVLPTTSYYQMVVQSLTRRSFDPIREIQPENMEWKALYEATPSIEIHFEAGLSFSALSKWTTISRLPSTEIHVDRIWIYYDESSQEIRTLFISDQAQKVFLAETDYSHDDLKRYLTIGRHLPSYTMIETSLTRGKIPRGYYLPNEPEEVIQYRLFYQPFTGDQMKSVLFVDPSIIRQVQERDGSVIYTDGSRGLQIRPDKRWFTYNAPVPPSEKRNDDSGEDRMITAIQFVNQHGGWNGEYRVAHIPKRDDDVENYLFRQYYGSYPIFEMGRPEFSLLELQLVDGVVSTYNRSLITMDKVIEERVGQTADKTVLIATLDSLGIAPDEIQNVRLAYQSKISNEYVDLVPVWIVETYTPEPLFIPAMTGK